MAGKSENMSLKNKALSGSWISAAAKVFRREKNIHGENLPGRFEDWMYKECNMKKQTIYNYKNIYKLMRIVPKLMTCRVNNYFNEENEEQSWKHSASCDCEGCNSYSTELLLLEV